MEGEEASDSLCTSEESLEGARATPMDQRAHPSIHVWKKNRNPDPEGSVCNVEASCG